jgi:hypothetical protein
LTLVLRWPAHRAAKRAAAAFAAEMARDRADVDAKRAEFAQYKATLQRRAQEDEQERAWLVATKFVPLGRA